MNKTHGATSGSKGWARWYRSYHNMKQRCFNKNNPDFKHYGGRGITVCAAWKISPVAFFRDMGECPEGMGIDRIDVNGNYGPLNCRWATQSTQMSNTRKNIFLTYQGKRLHIAEWARITGLDAEVLRMRYKAGWPTEEIFVRPIGRWFWDKRGRLYLDYDGRNLPLREWAKLTGFGYTTLRHRAELGWTPKQILTTPKRPVGGRWHPPHE